MPIWIRGIGAKNMRMTPEREDRFAFGLWTIGNLGRDAFGEATREVIDPSEFVRRLSDIGAWGVSFHDDDLMSAGASESVRRGELDRFKKTLEETGIVCSMATTNLFWHPVFKDGAFTSNDRNVRRYAIQKTIRNIDVAAELGAPTYVLWGGREGVETPASKEPAVALDRYKEALDFLCSYVAEKGYKIKFAIEPKPNEPRGDAFLPTVGHALAFINELEIPEMVGLNPEVAHETMAGLSFFQAVAQTLWSEKLFHIDLTDQKIGRFDQDLRFGSEGLKDDFMLVRLLESSTYAGPKHFDARPYRNVRGEGIWTFAESCMRNYLILADKAKEFNENAAVKAAMEKAKVFELEQPTVGGYTDKALNSLMDTQFDIDSLAKQNFANDELDQLIIDQIFGV